MIAVIYSRVSSPGERQSTTRQVLDLTDYAGGMGYTIMRVFEEKVSGATAADERPVLQECLQFCREKRVDAIFITELSRLSRKMFDAFAILKELSEEKINVICKEPKLTLLDPDGNVEPATMLLIATATYFAELERSFIHSRLESGRQRYKEKGGTFGRREGSVKNDAQYREQYGQVIDLLQRGVAVRTVAELCHKSPSTVAKIKKMYDINRKV